VYWIELWKLHRARWSSFGVTHRTMQRVHFHSIYVPNEPTSSATWTCVFTQPACLTLSPNKKFEATLTHDIHWISVFTNQGVHHGNNIKTSHFKNCLKYLLVCNWIYFKPREFLLYRNFHSSIHESTIILCVRLRLCAFSLTLSLSVYQKRHSVNSVCEKAYSSPRGLFYFQCSAVDIYIYKGKYLIF